MAKDWGTQQRQSLRSFADLCRAFPEFASWPADSRSAFQFRFALTPYFVDLLSADVRHAGGLDRSALWRQVAPVTAKEIEERRPDAFDGVRENWETESEMRTGVLHKKYPDRAVLRIRNDCSAYCQFCLEALRVLDFRRPKVTATQEVMGDSLTKIRQDRTIRDVILSGGEPLLMSDRQLDYILGAIRQIEHVEFVRVHTRTLLFNPVRITDALAQTLRRHDVTEIALHVAHPAEITDEFQEAVARLHHSGALLLAHIPLLRGVNDCKETLERLFRVLYSLRIRPYYLLHCMPFVLAPSRFRTSVRRGVQIMRELKRHVSNPMLPEFVIVHESGKRSVPSELCGTDEFVYEQSDGWPVVRFLSWAGHWETYLDSPESNGGSLMG